MAGFKALAIEMDVKLTGISQPSAADIAHSDQSVLLWTAFLSIDTTKIMVKAFVR